MVAVGDWMDADADACECGRVFLSSTTIGAFLFTFYFYYFIPYLVFDMDIYFMTDLMMKWNLGMDWGR